MSYVEFLPHLSEHSILVRVWAVWIIHGLPSLFCVWYLSMQPKFEIAGLTATSHHGLDWAAMLIYQSFQGVHAFAMHIWHTEAKAAYPRLTHIFSLLSNYCLHKVIFWPKRRAQTSPSIILWYVLHLALVLLSFCRWVNWGQSGQSYTATKWQRQQANLCQLAPRSPYWLHLACIPTSSQPLNEVSVLAVIFFFNPSLPFWQLYPPLGIWPGYC